MAERVANVSLVIVMLVLGGMLGCVAASGFIKAFMLSEQVETRQTAPESPTRLHVKPFKSGTLTEDFDIQPAGGYLLLETYND